MAELERLNKFLAHAGIGSRRHCEELILRGRIAVNGDVVRELGTKIDPATQTVTIDGKALQQERHVYWLVNKPKGYLCTNHDPSGRPLAIDLVEHVPQRVYTVGRLDEDSEGLLLLTNDGELAQRLTHPRYGVDKTYLVQVAGKPDNTQLDQLLKGIWLSDGHVKASKIKRLKTQGESTWLEIVLQEGKNREIRRMLARLEHKVLRLKRVAIGPIQIGKLRSGKSRPLKGEDLERLQRASQRRFKPQRDQAKPVESAELADPPGQEARPARPNTPRLSSKTRLTSKPRVIRTGTSAPPGEGESQAQQRPGGPRRMVPRKKIDPTTRRERRPR